MPHATDRFPFEFRMLSWAHHLSHVMTGENRCFLLVLDSQGAVRQLLFGEDEYNYDSETWQAAMQSNPCWLFYHPFDGPVHTYMQWQNVQRTTLERLTGRPFEDADFFETVLPQSPQTAGERVEFPVSWNVMF